MQRRHRRRWAIGRRDDRLVCDLRPPECGACYFKRLGGIPGSVPGRDPVLKHVINQVHLNVAREDGCDVHRARHRLGLTARVHRRRGCWGRREGQRRRRRLVWAWHQSKRTEATEAAVGQAGGVATKAPERGSSRRATRLVEARLGWTSTDRRGNLRAHLRCWRRTGRRSARRGRVA